MKGQENFHQIRIAHKYFGFHKTIMGKGLFYFFFHLWFIYCFHKYFARKELLSHYISCGRSREGDKGGNERALQWLIQFFLD